MSTVNATRITPVGISAWQITPQTAPDLVTALSTLAFYGYSGSAACTLVDGQPSWVLTLKLPGYPDKTVVPGDWIVVEGSNVATYTNDQFCAVFTADIPIAWAATTTPPAATALPGLQALLTFPAPSSCNAPFTYTVEQTTGAATTTASIADIKTANDQVTLYVTGLTDQADYTFAVTVTTRYEDATATSVASNQITAGVEPLEVGLGSEGQLSGNIHGFS